MGNPSAHVILEAALNSATTDEARNRIEDCRYAPAYAEPGYSPAPNGVVFGDWNDLHLPSDGRDPRHERARLRQVGIMARLSSALGRAGVGVEWCDEWTECAECGKAVRIQPNSYGWLPSYVLTDDGEICHECVAKDPETYFAMYEGNERKAWTLTYHVDPADHGYTLLEDGFENGLHPGQDDNPEEIATRLRAQGIERFLFVIPNKGQFEVNFSVYARA